MRSELKHIICWVTTIMLAMLVTNAFAQDPPQNTGDDPYIGTTHRYVVTADQPSINTITWEITDGPNTYNPTHATIDTSSSGNLMYIDIEYRRGDYPAGEWTLTYTESNSTEGCVATREFTIYLTENTFYESLYNIVSETPPGSFSECHDSTGTAQVWSEVISQTFETHFTFPVYMYKNSEFDLVTWSFYDTLWVNNPNYILTSANIEKGNAVSGEGADFTITEVDDNTWVIEVDSITGISSDSVLLRCTVEGPMYESCDLTMDIYNGEATSGSSITVTTPDNDLDYPDVVGTTPDEWRTKTVTILGVPDTRDITHDIGEGETAWSAANPLQYSTHNYTVEMGDVANYSLVDWYIAEDGTPVDPADYGIVIPGSADVDSADVEFTFNMDPGTYTLVFTETDITTGCSSIREYTITLGDPFDVDIADEANTCPDISDQFTTYNAYSIDSVDYIVNLVSTAYEADWQFDFGLSCVGDFGPTGIYLESGDITITDVNGSGTVNFTPGGDDYSGSVSVAYYSGTPTTQFTIRVYYHSRYYDQYEITAAMSNITGTYGERDENTELGTEDDTVTGFDEDPPDEGGDQNNTVHLIYELPRTLALEGVD